MRSPDKTLVGGLILFVFASATPAQPPDMELPDPKQGYHWKEVAQKQGLSEQDVQTLATDKILMTNEAFKQVFTPYIESNVPLFITSDSVLNAFHVLFEESVLRLEQANARKLPGILQFIWRNLATADEDLKGNPQLVAGAKRRAQVVIGTAIRLLGDETIRPDPKIAALIEAEVKRVTAAKDTLKPEWLGPPDRGFTALDYSRYRPRGFYTKSERLERYFRAVSWLQSIPFRLSKDEELLSILMLGNSVTYDRFRDDFPMQEEFRTFFRRYREFIGTGDDWDLMTAAHAAQSELRLDLDGNHLADKRERLLKRAAGYGKGPKVSDQLAFAPDEATQTAEVSFRIVSAYRTPDAVLFQRTTDLRKFTRPFPTGLELCAALGSPFARARLQGKEREQLLATIDECEVFFSGSSLYLDYLRCLRALLDEPEPDAPGFMSSELWQAKSCQTALAGWAQLRHTWALQAKPSAYYLGLTEKPPGFVEPEPEFFSRLAGLIRKTESLLDETGALDTDLEGLGTDIRAAVALLERKQVLTKGPEGFGKLSDEEKLVLGKIHFVLMALSAASGRADGPKKPAKMIAGLKELADQLQRGEMPDDPLLARMIGETAVDLAAMWRALGAICRRVETLAHKQLRRIPFSEEENQFFLRYGEQLAGVMLYAGNSYLTPRDDAPRVVDVFHNPNVAESQYLEVGVARARALYVLYPVQGREILCRGAVMPYYEFRHDRRLTDSEWKALLDSPKRPEIPGWVRPIVGSAGIVKPELKDHP